MSKPASGGPGWRAVAAPFALAVGLRGLLVAASLLAADASLEDLAALHDGRHYRAIARALGSAEELRELPPEVRRLGPGYPLLVRLLDLVLPDAAAALAVSVLAAGAATALLRLVWADARTSAWFAVFTPSWVLFSATAMSESTFLASALGALLAWRRRLPVVAGLLLGFATLVRPVGALVLASLCVVALPHREQRAALRAAAAWAVLPLSWSLVATWLWGNPLQQPAAYIAKDWSWPFASLLAGLARPWLDPLKAGQVVLALVFVAAGGYGLWLRYRERAERERLEELAWLGSNACFWVALPSAWVFECLPRFLVSALPPALVGLGRWLPSGRAALAAAAAASLALGVVWNVRALGALAAGA